MFDVGWQELFVIAVVTIIVVGPKEIPRVLRTVTLGIRKVKGMAREFQSSLEELAREAELDEIKQELQKAQDGDLQRDIEDAIDPTGDFGNSIRDIEKSLDEPAELPGSTQASILPPEEPEAEKEEAKLEGGTEPDDRVKKNAGEPG